MARGKQIIKLIDKSISECFAIYIKNCRVKNLSPQTITTYKQMCSYFIEWYGADESIRNVNTEVIEDYIIYLQGIRAYQHVLSYNPKKQFASVCVYENAAVAGVLVLLYGA